jgi:hypothetical protein
MPYGVNSNPYYAFAEDKQQYQGFLNQGQNWLQQALEAIQGGYGDASKSIAAGGRASKRQALDRETQLMGGVNQGMTNRGLGNTSLLGNAQRGVAGDTTRRLQEIDQSVNQAMAGLQERGGMAQAGAMGSLSNFMAQRGGIESGLNQRAIDYMLARRQKKDSEKAQMWGTIATGIGTAASMFAPGLGGFSAAMGGMGNAPAPNTQQNFSYPQNFVGPPV